MATGNDEQSKLTFSRVVHGAHETLCQKLALKEVGTQLTIGDRLPKPLRKHVRYAVKTKDAEHFYSTLLKFDIKSFVFFLEVLDSTSTENSNHREILSILSHYLEHLHLEEEPSVHVMAQLQSITSKYLPKKSTLTESLVTESARVQGATLVQDEISLKVKAQESLTHASTEESLTYASTEESLTRASTEESLTRASTECDDNTDKDSEVSSSPVVLYYEHPVETVSFNKTDQHVLYSPTHDITVSIGPEAFPKELDTFELSLAVNDYSQHVTMPPEYTGVFSALISLQCKPHFEEFQDYVTVTIPHCAAGDIEGSLCVLSAADTESKLVEDPDIEIESIDEHYLTFRTKHFCKERLSKTKKRRIQKFLDRKRHIFGVQRPHLRNASSFSGATNQPPINPSVLRSQSSPASSAGAQISTKFYAVMYMPCDTSCAHWKLAFIVTYDLFTFSQELRSHAANILGRPHMELCSSHTRFTFLDEKVPVELTPAHRTSNGWTIASITSPKIYKDDVEEYWHLPREGRVSDASPFIVYTATKADRVENTNYTFSITLEGTQSNTYFNVPCLSKEWPLLPKQNSIKIIKEMYSDRCLIIEGLLGHSDCSDVSLDMRDVDCCTLFCEISFHLCWWEKLGRSLQMKELDIDEIRHYKYPHFFESAFQLLKKWFITSVKCQLKTLIDGLNLIGLTINVSTWSASYNIAPSHLSEPQFMRDIAPRIRCHWKFVARLLGLSETDIDDIVQEYQNNLHLQAYEMLKEWNKRRTDSNDGKLFDSLHCVNEHIYIKELQATPNLF